MQIWEDIRTYVIDTLYIKAAETADPASFKTNVDNLLDVWVNKQLPALSVAVASQTLMKEFFKVLDFEDTDGVFDKLKESVKAKCSERFRWDPRTENKLRSVQELKLRDDVIGSSKEWSEAVRFMVQSLQDENIKLFKNARWLFYFGGELCGLVHSHKQTHRYHPTLQ